MSTRTPGRTSTTVTRAVARVLAATGLAAATAVGTASVAGAQPHEPERPLAVYQIPALGLHVSGLVVPGPYFASVIARSTGTPGEVNLSAPAPAAICSGSAASAHVTVNYLNLSNGRAGEVTVKPCPTYTDPTPTDVVTDTGSGQVAMSIRVTGSPLYPDAGQPALPGAGTFRVP